VDSQNPIKAQKEVFSYQQIKKSETSWWLTRYNSGGIGNAPYTVNKRLQELQTFLNWCYKLEYFDRPIKIDRVKVVAREPLILDHEDEARLVKRIKYLIKINKSVRYKTTYTMQLRSYYMLAFTRMRKGDPNSNWIKWVFRFFGNKQRKPPLPRWLAEDRTAYLPRFHKRGQRGQRLWRMQVGWK